MHENKGTKDFGTNDLGSYNDRSVACLIHGHETCSMTICESNNIYVN